MRLTDRTFAKLIEPYAARMLDAGHIVVAVSGGGDSLALLYLLSRWAKTQKTKIDIHALTVDHGLRRESKAEAKQVGAWVAGWPCVTHTILTWRGTKPKTRISETARAKRYDLMRTYCKKRKMHRVVLAHTLDDQAETFLLRLAAGSGLDGLACMRSETVYKDIVLWRPLLSVAHDDLLATLRAAKQSWIEDPTNQNPAYARPRLRAARDILAAEGLTNDRLAKTAARILRGVERLEWDALYAWREVIEVKPRHFALSRSVWEMWDEYTRLRVLTRMIATSGKAKTPPRLEQLEVLDNDIHTYKVKTVRRTLGGCVITLGEKHLKIKPEIKS